MTTYEDIFNVFRSKVTDYDLASLTEELEESYLTSLMVNAIAEFSICDKLTDKDNENKSFNDDLSEQEIDILTDFMMLAWVKPQLYNSDKTFNFLSNKDYSIYSPANLLNQLRGMKADIEKDALRKMRRYSIINSDYEKMTGMRAETT